MTNNNCSTSFLEYHMTQGHAWAAREFAIMCLKGIGMKTDSRRGRTLMLAAARSSDRKAGWLLAVYYKTGQYNFPIDKVRSNYWLQRTEKRLHSDARLLYDNHDYAARAIKCYARWCEIRDWLGKW